MLQVSLAARAVGWKALLPPRPPAPRQPGVAAWARPPQRMMHAPEQAPRPARVHRLLEATRAAATRERPPTRQVLRCPDAGSSLAGWPTGLLRGQQAKK